jgi:N-acetylated-alpha-linked acidic dipeptidase
VYDFMVPGDPLTPGWASLPGARRIPSSEAVSLPRIMSAPLSYKDARVILEALQGPAAPSAWQGALPFTYHVGAGPATVRMRLQMDDEVRPIWTVTGRIRGSAEPESLVLLGNHRDAWVFGGVDPSSGSAAMMELARSLGELARAGVRPRRTVVFASWDAEEFTLTSSTEWGEQHEGELRDHAVAYVNVDSAASGPKFGASAVPSLNRLITESAESVGDPAGSATIAAATRKAGKQEGGALPSASGSDHGEFINNRLGSGSDYTVFLNHLGIPIVDMAFTGPYGVYHSVYDNHLWVSRIGDPGFRYHAAMARVWGVIALRLANAPVLPLDYRLYAARIAEFVEELGRRKEAGKDARIASALNRLRPAAQRFVVAAKTMSERAARALQRSGDEQRAVNRALMTAERALTDPDGIPGRPWYRHQIYAPKFTYAAEVLPGVSEALESGDVTRVEDEVNRLVATLDRAVQALKAP